MKKLYLFILILMTLLVFLFITCNLIPMSSDEYYIIAYDISIDDFSPPDGSSLSSSNVILNWEGNDNIKGFHLQISESHDFTGNLVVDDNTLTSTSYSVTEQLTGNQYYYWRIRFKNKSGEWESWFSARSFYIIGTLIPDSFETNDGKFSTLNKWELGGEAVPFVQSTTVHNGSWAAQFGSIGRSGESYFKTTVEFNTSKILCFYFSSDSDSGDFDFYIDSNTEYSRSTYTATPWIQIMILIEPGIHELKWMQDKYYDTESATMWIDDITISDIEEFVNDDFEINDGSFSTLNNWMFGGAVEPFVQSTTVHNSSWAVQFGNIGQTGESYFRTIVEFNTSKIISFYFSSESDSGDFHFYVDSSTKHSRYNNKVTSWTQIMILIEPGIHELKWMQDKYYDTESATMWIDDITIYDIEEFVNDDFETNDGFFSTLNNWGLGGNVIPFIQNTTVHNGNWAPQFGPIGVTGDSYFQTIVEFNTSKTISFYFSSENRSGDFYFYVDSSTKYSKSGYTATSWTQILILIEPGIHDLKWRQIKYNDTESATMWVDDITITDSK